MKNDVHKNEQIGRLRVYKRMFTFASAEIESLRKNVPIVSVISFVVTIFNHFVNIQLERSTSGDETERKALIYVQVREN